MFKLEVVIATSSWLYTSNMSGRRGAGARKACSIRSSSIARRFALDNFGRPGPFREISLREAWREASSGDGR